MQIRGILFDKDGTLLDFDCYWVSVARAATAHLLDILSCEEALAGPMLEAIGVHGDVTDMDGALCYGTFRDVSNCYEAVLRSHGIGANPDEVYRLTVDAYHACANQGIIAPICENLAGVLRELRGRGIKLALATADDPVLTELCLKGLGIAELFDRVYTADGIHPPKPDPYYIHRFAEEEGLAAEELIMVGDTMNDIRFARNGGIAVVGVAKTEENRRRLEGAADVILPDVSFLAEWIDGGCPF